MHVHDLIDLSERTALAYAERFVGQILEVIPEREYKELLTAERCRGTAIITCGLYSTDRLISKANCVA